MSKWKGITAKDIVEAKKERRTNRDSTVAWFDPIDLSITVRLFNYEYTIELERCQTADAVLDWIFQVGMKTTCSPKALQHLLWAFEDASRHCFNRNFQGVLCPGGQENPVVHRARWDTGIIEEAKREV